MNKRRRFIVELDMPRDVSYAEMMAYIEDAVATMKESLEPPGIDTEGDPLFELDGDSVRVIRYRRPRR